MLVFRYVCVPPRWVKFYFPPCIQEHSEEELKAWKLVRVSEDFRVIALGLPVPRYHGNPLDPPLRSRFQARDIHLLPFKVSMDQLFTLEIQRG